MDDLISVYKQRLNLQSATFSRIEHEDAMVADVYKVTLQNGNELILKICARSNDYLREVYFLNYFATKLQVPRITQVLEPEGKIHGAILMECLPGSLLQMTEFTDELSFKLGSMLATIHLNRTFGYGDLIKPEELSSDPRIPFTEKFDEGFAECSEHLPKTLLKQCRHYFDAHVDLLRAVDGPCIVHRDFRPGNVIVHQGKLQGIIDWSSARASFAEEDFIPMEHGEWSAKPKKSFLSGYASVRKVPDYSATMPLLRLSKGVATIGFTVKQGTWDNIHARIYQLNRQFLDTFF